jgi:hypothetical protein
VRNLVGAIVGKPRDATQTRQMILIRAFAVACGHAGAARPPRGRLGAAAGPPPSPRGRRGGKHPTIDAHTTSLATPRVEEADEVRARDIEQVRHLLRMSEDPAPHPERKGSLPSIVLAPT